MKSLECEDCMIDNSLATWQNNWALGDDRSMKLGRDVDIAVLDVLPIYF